MSCNGEGGIMLEKRSVLLKAFPTESSLRKPMQPSDFNHEYSNQ
ncbi:hypothetical protein P4H39_03405 [Paenibacillus lautus]|nr:hypothetical protein [Paenibacillus lautus]MEC0201672.1 hypothetical protein [Paenibacillus lautus]